VLTPSQESPQVHAIDPLLDNELLSLDRYPVEDLDQEGVPNRQKVLYAGLHASHAATVLEHKR